jgi:hypothetical protein
MAGHQSTWGAVSGNEPVPVIDLRGTSMSALALAIPAIASRTGREVVVIGGLAVVCRLTRPYRANSDLDTVNRRGTGEPAQLDPAAGPVLRSQLEAADPQLRVDASLHAKRWFEDHADRSLRLARAVPEGRGTQLDDLRLVGELLQSALTGAPQV